MDNFKKYIQENKPDLDLDRPGSHLWERIEQDLEIVEVNKKTVPMWRWMVAAACLLLVLVSAFFLFEKNKKEMPAILVKKEVPKTTTPQQNPIPIAEEKTREQQEEKVPDVKPETFASVEKKKEDVEKRKSKSNTPNTKQYVIADVEVGNFSQVIEYQRQYISTLPIYGEKPGYFKDFKQQLQQMDSDEKEVRSDIKKHGLNPNQIEQLINIYQQKITLLRQLNQEINRVNKSYLQNHIQQDSTSKMDNPHFLNL
ncbi:MAG: hypothetical protein DI598_04835 [Pseudopedobacter saltans]|uniref:Anti-sigma factor n=1 Tax=Pseudopedobacter saltans TaxID=151895 RepID=A0A2W5F7G3_9SPHI|nr:MAG: hypothetical protein DI598_04835 [Pseudopedobacter saltans]